MTIRSKLVLLLAVLVVVGVTGYNLWSFSCGHCTLRSLMTLGPAGHVLLVVNILLAGLLVYFKQRRRQQERQKLCRCGSRLIQAWKFCPFCGEKK